VTATARLSAWLLIAAALAARPAFLPLRAQAPGTGSGQTLRLHPGNPRYFLFRGKPAVVITSGEHYGAVLNRDFDYRRYFDTLQADGLNGTRIFSGTYVETGGNFNIAGNTLDPARGRFISPWARSGTDGYADGGARFDLTRFDEAYVSRLRDVLKEASARGIIVELVLFCPLYEDSMWAVSPMNPVNNVNGFPAIRREDVLTLDRSGPLLAVQDAVARHLVAAVAGFDNVYLEICNEPYATRVPEDWQRHMTTVVADAVAKLPQPVLLSQNVSNQGQRVVDPHPAISIFNFHYATPPDTIAWNAHLGRVIGDNETGFRGTADLAYRTEGWDFVLAGGGLYGNLDYSFTVGHEDGTFAFPRTQPGGGGIALRRQLGILRRFIDGFDLVKLRPEPRRVVGGVPPGGSVQVLAEDDQAYAVYLRRVAPAGTFSARWTGLLVPPAAGTYQLHVTSNDGVRLTAGGRVVFEDWTDHATKTDTVSIDLTQPVPLVAEYFYAGGAGVMRLAWTRPDGVRETIPSTAWRVQRDDARDLAPGVHAAYYRGIDLADRWFERDEPNVDHEFGTAGPTPDVVRAADTPVSSLRIDVREGAWNAIWLDPVTGDQVATAAFQHPGGVRSVEMPAWRDDVALALRRIGPFQGGR
jgi:PA14 domain